MSDRSDGKVGRGWVSGTFTHTHLCSIIIIVYVKIPPLSNLIKINLHKWHVCRTRNFPPDRLQAFLGSRYSPCCFCYITYSGARRGRMVYLPMYTGPRNKYANFDLGLSVLSSSRMLSLSFGNSNSFWRF